MLEPQTADLIRRPIIAKSNSALIRTYMRPYWLSIGAACGASLFLGLIASAVATLVGPCLQVLTAADDNTSHALVDLLGPRMGGGAAHFLGAATVTRDLLLLYLPAGLIGLAATKALFYAGQSFLWERLGEQVSKDLRFDIMRHFIHLDPSSRKSALSRSKEEDLSSALSTDIKLMREYLVHFYGGLPRELLQVIFLGATLILLSPKLFILFFLAVAPAVALVQKLGRKLRKRAAHALADYSQLSEWLQQRLLGVETIKHYRSEATETAKFTCLTQELYEKFLKAARVKARTSPLVELVAIIALVVILILALGDIEAGTLTGAVAISFFASLALLSQSAAMVGRYYNSNREGAAAVDRIRTLLAFTQAHHQDDLSYQFEPLPAGELLACRDVTVAYPGNAKPALRGFSFRFARGRAYAVVGPSGAGKSTLFNVILGLQAAEIGRVVFSDDLQGNNLQENELQGFRAGLIGYLPQHIQLLSGSIAENIAYPAAHWDERRIHEALAAVALTSWADGLEHGILSELGPRGVGLSGGQAQRLLIARLHYHRFPLVLVDEGTSALDPESEQQIFALLAVLKANGATLIMIAHRRSALALADEILHFAEGQLLKNIKNEASG